MDPHGRSFDTVWAYARTIEGWLSEGQARGLFRAAEAVPPGQAIVELGSHHGKSAVVLAAGKRRDVRLVAVDPFHDSRWGGGEGANAYLASNLSLGGAKEVEIFQETSREAAEQWSGQAVGLLYVDGAHDRRSVLGDIGWWEPFVLTGGAVFFHDAFASVGVTMALIQRHLLGRHFLYLGSTGSLAHFVRVPDSVSVSARNVVRMTPRLAYFGRNILVKVGLRKGWSPLVRLLRHPHGGDPY